MNVRRGKPLIESVVISPDKRERINQILSTRHSANRQAIVRELAGGVCTICAKIPSKKVIYSPMEGVKLVRVLLRQLL